MDLGIKYFGYIIYFFCFIDSCDCDCQFPSELRDLWTSSTLGTLQFNATTLSGIVIPPDSCAEKCPQTLDCYMKNGSLYLLRSPEFTSGKVPLRMYTCWSLTDTSPNKIVYYHGIEDINEFTKDRSVFRDTEPSDIFSICNRTKPYPQQTYNLLLRSGSTPVTLCPNDVLGRYTDETSDCSLKVDMCSDVTKFQVSSNNCSSPTFYSNDGSLSCVHSVQNNDTSYLTLYNNDKIVDNSNTYSFTCLTINMVDGKMEILANPKECLENSTFSSDFYQMSPTEMCPITTAVPSNTTVPTELGTAEVVGLSFGVIFLLFLLLLLLCCLCWRQKKRKQKQRFDLERQEHLRSRDGDNVRLIGASRDRAESKGSDSGDSGLGHGQNNLLRVYSEEYRPNSGKYRPGPIDRKYVIDKYGRKIIVENESKDRPISERSKRSQESNDRKYVIDEYGRNILVEDDNGERPISNKSRRHHLDVAGHEIDEDGKSSCRSKSSKRTIIQKRILPDGTEVEEEIDIYDSDSDNELWYNSDDQFEDNLSDKIIEAEVKRENSFYMFQPTIPVSENPTTRRKEEKRNQIEKPKKSRGGIFKSLARKIRGSNEVDDIENQQNVSKQNAMFIDSEGRPCKSPLTPQEIEENRKQLDESRTPYLEKYYHKKSIEHALEDEGFFDEPDSKKRAADIFKFNKGNREGTILGSLSPIEVTGMTSPGYPQSRLTTPDIHSTSQVSHLESLASLSGQHRENTNGDQQIFESSRLSNKSNDYHHLHPDYQINKDKANTFADSHMIGNEKQLLATFNSNANKSKGKKSTNDKEFKTINFQDPDSIDTMSCRSSCSSRGKKSKRNRHRDRLEREASQLLTTHLGKDRSSTPLNHNNSNYPQTHLLHINEYSSSPTGSQRPSTITLPSMSSEMSSLRFQKPSYMSQLSSVSCWSKSSYEGYWSALDRYNAEKNHLDISADEYSVWLSKGKSHFSFVQDLNKKQTEPTSLFTRVKGPQHDRDLDGLLSPRHDISGKMSRSPTSLSDRYISVTPRSARLHYPIHDKGRLKRLLEELYLDKKYMDRLYTQTIGARDKCERDAHDLSEDGGQFLNHMASYWEDQKPLPPILRLPKESSSQNMEHPYS